MELAEVRYLGLKPNYRVVLPYPFVSISARTGEVVFEKAGDVQNVDEESAKNMIELAPNLFELVPAKAHAAKPAKAEKGASS